MHINDQTPQKLNNYFDHMTSDANDISSHHRQVEVSVVCPFFNEEQIIESAISVLLDKMHELNTTWELIVVNDGSTDNSHDIAAEFCEKSPHLRLLSYPINRGRGYALRTGIAAARGEIIITTEIDLSWGEDIVQRLYSAMREHQEADMVVASPHLSGGGYKNVPWKRVFFSRFGNKVIRTFMANAATMNTGMTRAYRRRVIKSLPLEEDHKEFHLEVIMKAQALKYRIHEIPCVLELSGVSIFISFAFFIWSVIRLFSGLVSVFTLIISLSFAVIALIFFSLGAIAQQGNMVQYEIWTLKQSLLSLRQKMSEEEIVSDNE
jgi:glycosyltransferase involved in cell wall biosynthesis